MPREAKFPLISVIIPTYNEESCIVACLESIFSQDYPKECLEVIIVDDFSSDNTRILTKKYNAVIVDSGHRDPQVSKMLGIRHSKGEIICLFDADFVLKSKEWFKKMIAPFFDDESVVACITGYHSNYGDPPINRYLNFDLNQRDPIYMFFSHSITKFISQRKKGYFLCEFKPDSMPPMAGGCVYRKNIIIKLFGNFDKFLDIDSFVLLVENGFNRFAYVPEAGIYHSHAHTLTELCKKRLRNVKECYLKNYEIKRYKWFDLSKGRDLLKITFWLMYSHSIILPLFTGIYKCIKKKDWAGLYEPVVCPLLTDIIIFGFVSQKKGRNLILQGFKQLFLKKNALP